MVMSVDDYIRKSVEFRSACQRKYNAGHRMRTKSLANAR